MRVLRFITALSLALLLHATLAKAIFDTVSLESSTAEGTGEAGMQIGLGMVGSYTDVIAQPKAEVEESVTAPVAAETAPLPEAPVEALVKAQPEQSRLPESTVPEPDSVKAVMQEDNSAATLAVATLEPAPELVPEPVKELLQESASEEVATSRPVKPAAAMQRATGAGSDHSTGGKAGNSKNYFAELMAWLNKHKSYPLEAKKEKQQGIVELQFTLQRDGSVSASSVKTGSGHALLDQAALDMLNAAAPLPALPASMDRQQITLVIPIEFSLITNSRYKE